MRILSQICSFFAIWLFHHEWAELRKALLSIYTSRLEVEDAPSTLAQQLLISGEDHRFLRHGGVDPIAVCRAIWRRITLGKREGASTIEMQIVRVVSGRFELTLGRKIREMALATLVTRAIPKEQLPAFYLQIGYYGWRMNGFKQACKRLAMNAGSLTPIETARLVARLKYPQSHHVTLERWNQINTRGRHLQRLHTKHESNQTYMGLNITIAYEAI